MASLARRIEVLEQITQQAVCDDGGLCHCVGPILFDVRFDDREPEPIIPSLCERCGREKERFEVIFDG